MYKYFTLFLVILYSCSTVKESSDESKVKGDTPEENTTVQDDTKDLPPPQIDINVEKEVDDKDKASIVEFPDKSASFPGGADVMKEWISSNMQYPETAKEAEKEGKVFVQFVVLKDGSIDKISILRGVSEDLDKEAIRLIKSMPKWNPGQQQGKDVNTRNRIAITFKKE